MISLKGYNILIVCIYLEYNSFKNLLENKDKYLKEKHKKNLNCHFYNCQIKTHIGKINVMNFMLKI